MLINTSGLLETLSFLLPNMNKQAIVNWIIFNTGFVSHRKRYSERFLSGEIISMNEEHSKKLSESLLELARETNTTIAIDKIFYKTSPKKNIDRDFTSSKQQNKDEQLFALREILSVLIDLKVQLNITNGKLEKLVQLWTK